MEAPNLGAQVECDGRVRRLEATKPAPPGELNVLAWGDPYIAYAYTAAKPSA